MVLYVKEISMSYHYYKEESNITLPSTKKKAFSFKLILFNNSFVLYYCICFLNFSRNFFSLEMFERWHKITTESSSTSGMSG